MQKRVRGYEKFGGKTAIMMLLFVFITLPAVVRAGDSTNGRKLATSQPVANCVACHVLPNVDLPGDVGPNLIESMKRYTEKDRETVRQLILDATKFNPDTIMPPYGRNKLITEKEIDDIVEYLYSLKDKK